MKITRRKLNIKAEDRDKLTNENQKNQVSQEDEGRI